MRKKIVIDIVSHAFLRMVERCLQFGLLYEETRRRAFQTVRLGRKSQRKHLSQKHITYTMYFNDGLSFYVICEQKELRDYVKVLIRTVIIERGRE